MNARSYAAKYTAEELKNFKDYYGSPPEFLAGFDMIKHSEREGFLAQVTESAKDFTKLNPVRSNLPLVNVLLFGKYKVRALFDSGSTHTLLSTGLVEKIAPDTMVTPTSLTFAAVSETGTG